MSTLASPLNKVFGALAGRVRIEDPLQTALLKKAGGTALSLALIVAVWILAASFLFNQVIFTPKSTAPTADLTLREASASIEDVVQFANSTEPIAEDIRPEETYPDAIEVPPLAAVRNPFASLVQPAPQPDLAELIRKRQQEEAQRLPIAIRGIMAKGNLFLAVLASDGASQVVRPGDTFMDWEVLAVGRDRVVLKKNGKTRTIAWEGNN